MSTSTGTRPFPIGPGYDMATGIGTPVVRRPRRLALRARRARLQRRRRQPLLGNQSSLIGTAVALPIAAHQSAGLPLTYTAAGLPPGLAIDPKTGAIAGTPTAGGASTVTASVADQFGDAASTQFLVGRRHPRPPRPPQRPRQTPPEAGLLVAALPGAKLRSLLVELPKGLEPNRDPHAVKKGISTKGAGGKRIATKLDPRPPRPQDPPRPPLQHRQRQSPRWCCCSR